ncbi:fractalkine [Camelus ferus]|uniref:Fractalkine n=1 Tax=Camelus ferus TaxID=419612 RepID=A0A8B8TJ68_CAMFR|nr:fractalkine [Camelus ferus]
MRSQSSTPAQTLTQSQGAGSVPWQHLEESSRCTQAPFLSPPTAFLPAACGGRGAGRRRRRQRESEAAEPHYKSQQSSGSEQTALSFNEGPCRLLCHPPTPDSHLSSAMALPPLSWLLRLAAFCHLTMLLAGQQRGVNKCSIQCSKMTTSKIPVNRLVQYQRNQESCNRRAIILTTVKGLLICADPKEEWVQKAMEYLDRQTAAPAQNGGTFERQIGTSEPATTPATRGMDRSAVSQTKVTGESSSQEAQRAFETSPELPTGVADSRGTRSPSTSEAPDGRPKRTELFNEAAITTTTSWQSSTAYQPGSGLWAKEKASEAPSTQTLPTQAPSTQASSTQAPTISHAALENNTGSEGQPVWIKTQYPTPENSLGPNEMGPISTPMDAFVGTGSTPDIFVVPVSSEGAPSMDPLLLGSMAPRAEEPIHTTVDPQRLGIPDSQAATRRQAVGLLAFLGLLFCLGLAMFAYQRLQGCPRKTAGDTINGLCYVPRSCGSNTYVLVPV